MFYNYEIKKNGLEEILYLYINTYFEFSKELLYNSDDKDLKRRTENFIKNNNIKFNGNKIYLVINGIVVKTLNTTNNNINYINSNDTFMFNNNDFNIIITDNTKKLNINLYNFLFIIINFYYNKNYNNEVLKCIAILYRTYAYKKMEENKFIDINDEFLLYHELSFYKLFSINENSDNYQVINKIITSTNCIFISSNGKYILPFIHEIGLGKTYSDNMYNYLSPVNSIWDLAAPNYITVKDFSMEDLKKFLKIKILDHISVNKLDENNCILELKINNNIYKITELNKFLNLPSNDFNIIIYNNFIRFISRGIGNNKGLSLYGANEMANNNANYISILKYYFKNVTLNIYKKELI